MPQYYKESGLLFTFPDDWNVIKSDEHRFYRYVSGRGFKGVDFIAIDSSGKLLLIEVKNYGNRFPADGIDPKDALVNNSEAYALNFIGKYEDTFHLIRIIHQYYMRKFWFRKIAIPLLNKWFDPRLLKIGWVFWWAVYQQMSAGAERAKLLLWLELGDTISEKQTLRLHIVLMEQFQKSFTGEHRIHIVNASSGNANGIKATVDDLPSVP